MEYTIEVLSWDLSQKRPRASRLHTDFVVDPQKLEGVKEALYDLFDRPGHLIEFKVRDCPLQYREGWYN